MEPDRTGTEQTSPRGIDWEVVQLTASAYESAPGPRRSEPSDYEEAAQGNRYATKGDVYSAAELLKSGHFAASKNEVQSFVECSDSKEQQEVHGSQDEVSNKGDDDLHRVPSFDKGKSLPLVDVEPDNGNMSQATSLIEEKEPDMFSLSSDSAIDDAVKELSLLSATESKTEKKTEEPALQNLEPVTVSSKAVASGEQNKPDDSRVPRDAWWRKQLISLYKSAKESNKLWPIFVAGAALMGMAYFRRRWQKGKFQLQQVKLQPSSSKERIKHAVGPLNRIKDILVAGNHPSPATNLHARLS